MKTFSVAAVIGLAVAFGPLCAVADSPVTVPLDGETVISGVGVACTGIGQTKDDPKWHAYPVRLEFANAQHAYLSDEVVTLSDAAGHTIFSAACEGPWLLLKLPDAKAYRAEARLAGDAGAQPRSATIKAPKHGQARFVLTFSDAQ